MMNSFNFVEEEQEQEDQGSDGAGAGDLTQDRKQPDTSSTVPTEISQTNFTRGLDLDNSPRPV